MTIINIVERLPNAECQKSATDHLEAVLARVRAGDTVTVGVVEVRNDGATSTYWSKSENINLLIGGAARLVHRLNAYLDEKTRS
jgi:hypothetical protein